MPTYHDLEELARVARIDTVKALWAAQSGHPGSSLSTMDVLVSLYFGGHLRHRAHEPEWPGRDVFILSQGHAAPGFYSVLALAGYLPRAELSQLRKLGSRLEGHVKRGSVPGVEFSAGSLGQGLNFGTGVAIAIRRAHSDRRVYVMTSDGEQQEGSHWEAVMFAASHDLSNLTLIVDMNNNQINGPVPTIMPIMTSLRPKYEAFGWATQEIDGHDLPSIDQAIRQARLAAAPSVILSHTTTGKGVPYMENDYHWHHGRVTNGLFARAMAALREEVSPEPDASWQPGRTPTPSIAGS